jgi:hypothetical protein
MPSGVPVLNVKLITSDNPGIKGKVLAVVCTTLVAINGLVIVGIAHSCFNAGTLS